MEQKQPFPLFVGPSFQSAVRRFNDQRTVNLVPEVVDVPGKGEQVAVLRSRPGLTKKYTFTDGASRAQFRGAYTLSNGDVSYFVVGGLLYSMVSPTSTPTLIGGTLLTTSGPISMADNGTHLMIVDGQFGYTLDLETLTGLVQITDDNFFPADFVTYLGGYFILNKKGSSFFFISDLDSIDFPPLNEQFAGASPDNAQAVLVNNQQLYVLGTRTIETWSLTGQTASAPFTPIQGRVAPIGIIAPFSLARLAGTYIWMGGNEQGDGVIYSMENDTPTRISNHAIEYKIQSLGDLSTSTAFALQWEGHQLYIINIPGLQSSLVFDYSTKQWTEWSSLLTQTPSVETRFMGQWHCFLRGQHVIFPASLQDNNRFYSIYTLDSDVFLDGDAPIRKLRQTPHVSKELRMLFYGLLEVDFQFGVGLANGAEWKTDPQVTMVMSKDGGQTWGNPMFASLGKIGEWKRRARFKRLGSARDVVFQVWVDAPVQVSFLSAWLSYEVGTA